MKNPTNFNRTSIESLTILVLADFWSFLSKGVHPLLHVGLLHVTMAISTERGREKMKQIEEIGSNGACTLGNSEAKSTECAV